MSNGLADFGAIHRAFGHRNFAIYTTGNSVAMIGLWVQRLGVGWLTWELTRSGFWLGAVAFADLFPAVVVGPFAGVLADRFDRLRIAFICQALSLAQTLLLFILAATGTVGLTNLMTLTLFLGIVRAVAAPVRLSLVPLLVPPGDVPAAVAISSVIFNMARFVGPALAGLIITASGVAPTFAFYAATVAALLFALSRIRIEAAPASTSTRHVGMLAQIAEGFVYTVRHRTVAAMLLLMLGLSLLARPVAELLPGFADAVFGRGAAGLAWFTSAFGLGAVAGGGWLAKRGRTTGQAAIGIAGVAGCAVSLLVFTGTDLFWVAVVALGVFGAAAVSSAVATQTLILAAVEDSMRGRVMSLYGVIFRGAPAVGSLLIGALSGPFGLRLPLSAGALLCLALILLLWRRLLAPPAFSRGRGEGRRVRDE